MPPEWGHLYIAGFCGYPVLLSELSTDTTGEPHYWPSGMNIPYPFLVGYWMLP